jgi:hypothetical protein
MNGQTRNVVRLRDSRKPRRRLEKQWEKLEAALLCAAREASGR